MSSFFSNQEIANLFPTPVGNSSLNIGLTPENSTAAAIGAPASSMPNGPLPTDPVQLGIQKAKSVPRRPVSAPAAPPAQEYGWNDLNSFLEGQEPIRPERPGFLDQLGTAINDGAGILGAGLGALAAPVEMVMAPVSGVLEQLAGSPLGRFGGGFGRGQANYQHGGFGLTPGPSQLQGMSGGQMDPAAIQAEIDRLQQLLLQSGG